MRPVFVVPVLPEQGPVPAALRGFVHKPVFKELKLAQTAHGEVVSLVMEVEPLVAGLVYQLSLNA